MKYLMTEIVVPMDVADAALGLLFGNGCTGCEEVDLPTGEKLFRASFDETVTLDDIKGYFPFENVKIQKFELVDSTDIRFQPKPFDPLELYSGTWIIPPADMEMSVPAPVGHHIVIRPGAAFGTGRHESTQLASEAIYKLSPLASLLDVGSGSGVLAIVASLNKCPKIVAVEIDDMSRVNAEENFELNDVKVALHDYISKVDESFDCVVANIITPVHLELKEELIKRVSPAGYLILSGIVIGEKEIIEQAFNKLTLVEMNRKNEWISFVFKK